MTLSITTRNNSVSDPFFFSISMDSMWQLNRHSEEWHKSLNPTATFRWCLRTHTVNSKFMVQFYFFIHAYNIFESNPFQLSPAKTSPLPPVQHSSFLMYVFFFFLFFFCALIPPGVWGYREVYESSSFLWASALKKTNSPSSGSHHL